MDWDDARLFLAVARAGQMLGAARRLGLDQATVSRRVAALEANLGAQLLIRRPHGCAPTEAGAALLAALERAEAEMLRAEAAVSGTDAAISGVVRIGAPDGFGVAFLAPRLGRLAERHPDLVAQLVPAPQRFSLSEREADLAVMVGRPAGGRLVVRKLTDYTLGLYAAPSYLALRGAPASPEALAHHRLVGHVEDLIYAPGLDYDREFLRGWRSATEVSGALGQAEAVRGGAGIGVLHDYIARGLPGLVPVLPARFATRAYWLAWPESLRDAARVRAAARFLAEIVAEARAMFTPDREDAAPRG